MLAADWAEPNNTPYAPFDIGHVEGWLDYWQLSIDSPNDDDWYRFDINSGADSNSYIAIDFTNSQGDLDLELYRGSTLVDYSSTSDDGEEISLDGLPAGTYYAHVYGYEGDANNNYEARDRRPRRLRTQ